MCNWKERPTGSIFISVELPQATTTTTSAGSSWCHFSPVLPLMRGLNLAWPQFDDVLGWSVERPPIAPSNHLKRKESIKMRTVFPCLFQEPFWRFRKASFTVKITKVATHGRKTKMLEMFKKVQKHPKLIFDTIKPVGFYLNMYHTPSVLQ